MRLFTLPRTFAALLAVGVSLPIAARAHSQDAQQQSGSQDSSVAGAARRSREKKKNPSNPAKSTKVITDDDLDKRNFSPGNEGLNVGSSPKLETEPPSAQAVATAEAADSSTEQDAKDAAEQDRQIAKLKLQIADAEKDLDLDKRQLALDQDSYFSNPDYSHDAAGKTRLQDEKQQIDSKQQDIERLKTKLAAQEELKSHRKPARTQAAPQQTQPPSSAPPQS